MSILMIGLVDKKKEIFIAQNFEELMIDSASGNGKYLIAYAKLSGCEENSYSSIFGESNPKQVYENLEKHSCLK